MNDNSFIDKVHAQVDHWGKVHSQKYKSGYEYEPQQTMTLRALDDPKEVDRMRSELALQQEKDAARHKTSACAECHLKETSAQLKKHWKYEYVYLSFLILDRI